jgi:capsular exopolysaccharide synthesis family protein
LEPKAIEHPLTMEHDPHGAHAESIRRLRTNLMFVDVTTGRHSFVLTSAMPGEGKTTTTINLALAIADAGSRVVLVDGDLRNPSVAKALGLEGGVGLTTALLGRASLAEVIQPWGDTGMSVLPAGQIPPNPSELLGSRPMAELFEKLAADFDFVLIDSPPLVPVIDAVLLQRLTGGLVMVVAAERTRKKDLATALTSLQTVEVAPAGFVLNFVPVSASDPYRYGTYRYQRPPEEATVSQTARTAPPRGRASRKRRRR